MSRLPCILVVFSFTVVLACAADSPGGGASEQHTNAGTRIATSERDATTSEDASTPSVTSDAATTDGGADTWLVPTGAPDCDLSKPFDAGAAVTAFPRPAWHVTFSPDETIAFFPFDRGVPDGSGIHQVTRANRNAVFGAKTPVASMIDKAGTRLLRPAVASNGLSMVLESLYSSADLSIATRKSVNLPFGALTPFYEYGGFTAARMPNVRADGKELFFSAKATGLYEIYRAPLSGGVVGPAVVQTQLTYVQPMTDSMNPVASFDGLSMYYNRNIPGPGVFRTTRASLSANFEPATRVSELPTNAEPQFLSPDECRLYYTQDFVLYVASRGK